LPDKNFNAKEDLLNFALNHVRDAAFLIDENARFQFVNEAACRATGYTRKELLQLQVTDVDPHFPIEKWSSHWRELQARRSLLFEGTHRAKDGRLFPVEVNANYFEFEGQGYNLALARDISERKAAERQQLESEERQRLAHEAAQIGTFDGDLRAHSVHWTPQLEALYGLAPGSFDGTNETFLALIHPDDRNRVLDLVERANLSGKGDGEWRVVWPDGTVRWIGSRWKVYKDEQGQPARAIGINVDVTERVLAQEALRVSEEKYRALFETANDCIHLIEGDRWIECNTRGLEMYGCKSRDEMIGTSPADFSPPTQPDGRDSSEKAREVIEAARSGNPQRFHWKHKRRDGTLLDVEVSLSRLVLGEKVYVLAIERDITERMRAEEDLFKSRQMLQSVLDNVPQRVFWKDRDFKYVACNKPLALDVGHQNPDDLRGKTDYDMACPANADRYRADDRAVMETGLPKIRYEEPQLKPDGTQAWLMTSKVPMYDQDGHVIGVLGTYEDITERKRAEEALRESELKYRRIVDTAHEGVWVLGEDLKTASVNARMTEILGYSAEEMLGRPLTDFMFAEDVPDLQHKMENRHKGISEQYERRLRRKDGQAVWTLCSATPILDEQQRFQGAFAMFTDITDRREAEETLRRLNRELRAISNCNQTVIRAVDEQQLLNDICRIICTDAGYRMAWVGFRETDEARTVRPVAWDGVEEQYLASAAISWADTARGRGPAGTAIRSGETVYVQDVANSPSFAPWRDAALKLGYRSMIGLPLKDASSVFGVLAIYSAEVNAFNGDEIRLLEELAGDLSFGIMALRARLDLKRADQERQQHLRFLEKLDWVNRAMQGASDLERMMGDALDALLMIFECDRAFLAYPCDPEAETWTSPMERTRPAFPGVHDLGLTMPLSKEGAEMFRVILESDGPVKFGPGSANQLPKEVAERFSIKSQMIMALHPKTGKAWQLGVQQCSSPRVWTRDEELLLKEIGRRLTDGLSTLLTYRNLQSSEAKLAEAQRIAHVGYWDNDLVTGSIDASDEVWRILGLSRQPRREDIWAVIHPDDRQIVAQATADMRQTGFPFDIEFRVLHPEEEVRFVRVQGNLKSDPSGQPRRMFGTVQDITERKKAEEALRHSEHKYRVFFEQNLAGNYITTPSGALLACNPALLRIFGYNSEAQAREINVSSLYRHPERREEFLQQIKAHGHVENFEKEFRRKDGSTLYAVENATGSFNERGELVEIHGFLIDETNRRKAEQQLRQAQKMEAIGTLAGGIAHDFNNILSVINGYSEILLSTRELDSVSHHRVQEILQAGQRAAALTGQLLAFSRKQVLQPKVLSLNMVIEKMEQMLHRVLGDEIEIVTSLQPDLDAVKADPTQMEQVILNLCINARDSMPQGGRIAIDTSNVNIGESPATRHLPLKSGRYACLTVTDSGTGMDKETLSHIFEPFFTTKEPGKGTGLGLATVHSILEQSGGHITVHSQPGRGSAFSIYLPASAHPRELHAPRPWHREIARGSETILVVEDSDDLRSLTREVLVQSGYTVLEADDGQHAIQIAESHTGTIHLLLSDVSLPKINGPSVGKALKEQRSGIKVLYMSGYADSAIIENRLVGPGALFLQKPFSLEDLLLKVREVLDTP